MTDTIAEYVLNLVHRLFPQYRNDTALAGAIENRSRESESPENSCGVRSVDVLI